MRIGVTALSFELVMQEVAHGAVIDASLFDYARFARRAIERGFDHIELTLDMCYIMPGCLSEQSVEGLRKIKEENDTTFSAHLPLWSIEPASHVEEVRKGSVNAILRSVEEVENLRPTAYVLHATGALAAEFHRLKVDPKYKRIIIGFLVENARKSLQQLVDGMSEMGIEPRRIALESVEFPFTDTLRLAQEFDTSVCIDTGHILAGYPGDVNLQEAMMSSMERIGEIHLHDAYRRIRGDCLTIKDHLPLGAGDLNADDFLGLLRMAHFDGPIVFELPLEDALSSLKVFNSLGSTH